MRPLYSLIVTLALSSFILFTDSRAQAKEVPELPSQPDTASAGSENLSFCPKLQISSTGAICESPYGFTARLNFPQVDVESLLAGERFLPNTEATFSANNQVINGMQYRNITFHDLRHTVATLLLSKEINPKIVQEQLGHSSINLTLNTYSHVIKSMRGIAANALEEVVGSD
jgi:hypothetical protein